MNPKDAKFLHYRMFNPDTGAVQSRGGLTVAFVETAESKIKFAYAQCHGRDNYVRRLGRVKAAGRLDSPQYIQEYEGDVTSFINNQDAFAQSFTNMKRKFNKKKHREFGHTTAPAAV